MDSWFWEAVLLLCFTIPVIVLFAYAVWDVIRRHDASVGFKILWLIAFIIVPIVGALVYLVIRPPGTTKQQNAIASGETTAGDELQKLADLHDRGKLTDQEYDHLKAQQVDAPLSTKPGSMQEQHGRQLM